MLYNPTAFKVDDRDTILDQIAAAGLAMLVVNGTAGPLVAHVPMVLHRERGAHGVLAGHLARINPIIEHADTCADAVAVFPGPDAYISPNWYPSKAEHHRVVPTWNYIVVQARGRLRFIHDAVWLHENVSALTAKHEASQTQPWAVTDAPERFVDMQLKAITGFELEISALNGKAKLSQNRNQADRDGVVAGLDCENTPAAHEMRERVKRAMDTS